MKAHVSGLAIAALLGGSAVGARAGVEPSPFLMCQTAKIAEAARYAACRLSAETRALRKGLAPDFAKCDARFGEKWLRTQVRALCQTTTDLAAVQNFVAKAADDLIGHLRPQARPEACGLSFPECGGACPDGEVCHVVSTCGSGFGSCGSDAECEPFGCLPSGCECASLAGAKQVFVTSETYGSNLGGLLGGDYRCQTLADRAALGGSWKAWLSDCEGQPFSSAKDRLTHASALYVRTDGKVVADDWDDLTDGELENPIDKDENGMPASITPIFMPPPPDGGSLEACPPRENVAVWTSTDPSGEGCVGGDCEVWTGGIPFDNDQAGIGLATAVDGDWTSWSGASCSGSSATFHLYCIEQ